MLQAPRDGQTFLIDAANQLTNPFLIKDLPFDYETTWLPVTQLSIFPQVVAVKQEFPAKTIQEYIAVAKEKPGTISYGTPPAAGMGHMAGEELQRRAGIKLIHVALSRRRRCRARHRRRRDRFGDHHHLLDPPAAGRRQARVLAVTSLKRAPIFPDVPTMAESGYPGFDMNDWNGLFAAERHAARADRRACRRAVAEASRMPRCRSGSIPSGAVLVANTPAEFEAWLKASAPCSAS